MEQIWADFDSVILFFLVFHQKRLTYEELVSLSHTESLYSLWHNLHNWPTPFKAFIMCITLCLLPLFHYDSFIRLPLGISEIDQDEGLLASASDMFSFTYIHECYLWTLTFLLPGSFIFNILCPIYQLSLLCASHPWLSNFFFKPHFSCLTFSTLVHLVAHNESFNTFSSATSSLASCLFVIATIWKPYIVAGLTTTL